MKIPIPISRYWGKINCVKCRFLSVWVNWRNHHKNSITIFFVPSHYYGTMLLIWLSFTFPIEQYGFIGCASTVANYTLILISYILLISEAFITPTPKIPNFRWLTPPPVEVGNIVSKLDPSPFPKLTLSKFLTPPSYSCWEFFLSLTMLKFWRVPSSDFSVT